jgi:hypothetical protein
MRAPRAPRFSGASPGAAWSSRSSGRPHSLARSEAVDAVLLAVPSLAASNEDLLAPRGGAAQKPCPSFVRLERVVWPVVLAPSRTWAAARGSDCVRSDVNSDRLSPFAARKAELVTASQTEDGATDRGVPKPASEVVADSIRRWVSVAAFGGEPPKHELQFGDRVQPTKQAAQCLFVPEWRRERAELVGGESQSLA